MLHAFQSSINKAYHLMDLSVEQTLQFLSKDTNQHLDSQLLGDLDLGKIIFEFTMFVSL